MLYLILVPASGALLLFGNFFAGGNFTWAAFGWEFARVGAAMAGAFAIDGLLALLIRRLPARWFAPLAPLFSVGKRELKLYRFLRLPAWKNGVPEWGGFTSFRKNRLASPSDPAYLARFLLESNYGVAIHLAGALAGFALLAVPFVNARLSVALPVACRPVQPDADDDFALSHPDLAPPLPPRCEENGRGKMCGETFLKESFPTPL